MTRSQRSQMTFSAFLLAILVSLTAGCGGGGGGGGQSPIPSSITGTVNVAGSVPAANYTVKLGNDLSPPSAVTSATGAFTVSFDAARIRGNQRLFVYNPSGTLVDEIGVTIPASGGTIDTGTVAIGPPPPPP